MTTDQDYKLFHAQLTARPERCFLDVHHTCSPLPVSCRGWTEGFQTVPWECPGCSKTVESADELTYEPRIGGVE